MQQIILPLKALSDGGRVRIIVALMEHKELCACQITELLGFTGATVSRHLSILHNADLIQSRKEGRWVYYAIADNVQHASPILDWIKEQSSQCSQFQKDSKELNHILSCDPEDICRKQRGNSCCSK